MILTSPRLTDGQRIPPEFAFCIPHPTRHVALSQNRNPPLIWREVPEGTRSLALLCVDPDVPSVGDDVNRPDRTVPADLPRADFYHWVLVDLPPSLNGVEEGAFSKQVTPRGKTGPAAPLGARQGLNDYTGWFARDQDMRGEYFGYDGPCPPWNDAREHRYHFTVYALDVDSLPVQGGFTGPQVLAAMAGHILAQASLTVTYTLNPALLG